VKHAFQALPGHTGRARPAFGLLGLGGLDPFLITLDAYEEWVELHPLHR
jgi:hypothetical protein